MRRRSPAGRHRAPLLYSPIKPGLRVLLCQLLLARNRRDGGLPAVNLQFPAARHARSALLPGKDRRPPPIRAALPVKGVAPLARSWLNFRSWGKTVRR